MCRYVVQSRRNADFCGECGLSSMTGRRKEVTLTRHAAVQDLSMSADNDDLVHRRERYEAIVRELLVRPEFRLPEIQQACASEQRGFVTRVVNELVSGGWIVREQADSPQESAGTRHAWNAGRGTFRPAEWLDEKFRRRIKAAPVAERPRERLLRDGAEALRLDELLAILIRSGRPGESAMDGARKIADCYRDRLLELVRASPAELKHVSRAVDITGWCAIIAGIELGRRIAALKPAMSERITTPAQARTWCRNRFARLASDGVQEEFHIVTLNTKHEVLTTYPITVGTLDASLVHPREVFRPAIKDAAAAVILVHNHPSGDPTPSREDLAVTRRLDSAGDLLGIKVLDHIVLGRDSAVSIRELL
jgi:DNA repair protein RadC